VARPDLFIGIKLAHAHQLVALDDEAYLGVYDVARETGVPVLLHTGFSPFPGAEDDPAYYDPHHASAVVEAYPDVDFVLSHIGQGDARAVAHALDLAETHDNVWLEVSALGRPVLIDEQGEPASTTEPQYPAVLAAIRARGLVTRTLFASDGPQYSGSVRSYLDRIRSGMVDAGYSDAEIAAVLGGNFMRLYLPVR
jgi:predicted TIM-barrel fold metal-dependent hydrolase